MATLPEGVGLNTSLEYSEKPTKTFIVDQTTRQISGMDSGILAMRQAVEIVLRNERFKWQIYSSNFGSELEDLPGNDSDFIKGDLPRRIEEAFSVDKRILSVENFSFQETNADTLRCSFDVVTVFGTILQEVRI